ncbi:MAG: phage terminase large subunit [Pyrinomonadaceae bacterium]
MNPKLNVILGSYNQKLANRFSRKIRRVLEDSAFTAGNAASSGERSLHENTSSNGVIIINEGASTPEKKSPLRNRRVSARLNTAAEWETAEGGGVRAVGVGGGVTGFGAGLIVIDDPVKSRAEAESPTYREKTWDWFNDDIYTRLEPDAAIILIQTRWHEDDLAGRLLKDAEEEGGEQWDVICLPALAKEFGALGELGEFGEPKLWKPHELSKPDPLNRKPGQALCPQRFDEKALERIKRKLGSYSFSALYQQRPVPAGGGLFKREWFKKIIDKAPDGLKWKRGYDLAVSTKTSADYTASFRCAADSLGNIYIEGGFRGRLEYPEQRRYMIGRMMAEKNTEHGIELALHGQAFVQDLRREVKLSNVPFRGVKVSGDKFTRALAWSNRAEEGKIILVRGPWIQDFIEEACRFTGNGGAHDDQIDAVSLAVEMLAKGGNGFHTFR